MNNGNDADLGKIINFAKTASLNKKLGEVEQRLGEARIRNDLEQIYDLERQRTEILVKMNPTINTEIPYPPPIGMAAFYGLAGEIVGEIGPQSEADSVALLINLLTAYGNIIGNNPYFKVGIERHYLKLFVGLVGQTSKARKGTSWKPVESLFARIEPEWTKDRIQTGLSSGEGLISHVRDDTFKRVINKETKLIEDVLTDVGIEDKRLLVVEGEFAQTLKVLSREGNTLSAVIRNAWDSGNLQILTKNSPIKATQTHISILGHITKEELNGSLKAIEQGNGFANRFLWFTVDRSKSLPFGGDFDTVNLDYYSGQLSKAIEYAKKTEEVTWAEETRELWADIYPILSEGKPGKIGAITARAEAQVVRLASLYALLDLSNEIKPDHLWAAIAVWEYSEASVRYIFQQSTSNPLAEKVYRILIDNPQGMGRLEINNALGRHHTSNEIAEALEILKANSMAEDKEIKTSGRPKEVWVVREPREERNIEGDY